MNIRKWVIPVLFVFGFCCLSCSSSSDSKQYANEFSADRSGAKKLTQEQIKKLETISEKTVFIPAYSHIYHQENRVFDITTTLSINNTDSVNSIAIMAVKYYNTAGKLVREYIDSPLLLPPMATLDYVVPEKDRAGGSGANFLVTWKAEKQVPKPLIEAVMIDGRYGISFASRGKEIETPSECQE